MIKILPNIIVGYDSYGGKLMCGDMCEFKMPDGESKCGMIAYDEEAYKFVCFIIGRGFVSLDTIGKENIEYIFRPDKIELSVIPDGKFWTNLHKALLLGEYSDLSLEEIIEENM